jgi:hypothetical protein
VAVAFFLFWVFVAANLLSPVPVLAGICVGGVWTTGRVNVAFGVMGAAIVVLAAGVYFHDPNAEFVDAIYLGGAQFLAMTAWTVFIVMLIFVAGERFRTGSFEVTLDDVELSRAIRASAAEANRRGKARTSR